ncbi:hypothetical protein AIOL_001240 [Candidatus Rhodobacter oscarellae]|uniref:Serine aminopeptidase S33 domain-containing protein n=1 Tax=Candidatus Rhodobacter oscarellae TaxID=1675527 RepID=A0A0J9GS32_9RHOB|nr:alpha/beta fold hydrolase [Candidatus Rhodobacter lobularis]KMW56288.1 hypothetical protein AIOL_001240 [Candidatus Rhodobacter lobularis]
MTLPAFDPEAFGGDLDAYFARAEGRFDDITPGTQKRVIWAGEAGAKTPLSVVYIHGFSATSEEIRPIPDRVAHALGANLIYTRLTGHGRTGAALAEATEQDWLHDTAEALAAGRAAGDEVVAITTSTGGTLAALAALDPEASKALKGIVFVSPNFQLKPALARILTWPGVETWGPWVAGAERTFAPLNEAHANFWTMRYPSRALLPMARLVKHMYAQDFRRAKLPALFLYSPFDTVIDPEAVEKIAADWGGPTRRVPILAPSGDAPTNHVIAGDITSPGNTGAATRYMLDWLAAL